MHISRYQAGSFTGKQKRNLKRGLQTMAPIVKTRSAQLVDLSNAIGNLIAAVNALSLESCETIAAKNAMESLDAAFNHCREFQHRASFIPDYSPKPALQVPEQLRDTMRTIRESAPDLADELIANGYFVTGDSIETIRACRPDARLLVRIRARGGDHRLKCTALNLESAVRKDGFSIDDIRDAQLIG